MEQLWTELRAAVNRLNYLIQLNQDLRRQITALQQQIRDASGNN